MLIALLASSAFAAPTLGFVVGGTGGFGGSPDATWATASPMIGTTLGLHFAIFELWGGVSAQALQEADYDTGALGPHVINPVTADLGVGFGGQTFTAGLYGGVGFTGFERGLYARLNLGGPGNTRMGVEGRLYALGDGYDNTGAAALLYRFEVGGKHPRPRPPPPPVAPPPPPPPPVYHDDPYGT